MSEELKPCPCCGETAEIDTRQTFRGIADGRLMEALAIYCTGCTLQITVCYADVPDITTEQVIAMWNTRAQAQAAPVAEPVAWQIRTKTNREGSNWTAWRECSDTEHAMHSFESGKFNRFGIMREFRATFTAPQHDAELVEKDHE